MRYPRTTVFLTLGLLACAREGARAPNDEPVPVLITTAASRDGLPQPPPAIGSKRDEDELRRAEAAYSERIEVLVRALIPDLRRLGNLAPSGARLEREARADDPSPSPARRRTVACEIALTRPLLNHANAIRVLHAAAARGGVR